MRRIARRAGAQEPALGLVSGWIEEVWLEARDREDESVTEDGDEDVLRPEIEVMPEEQVYLERLREREPGWQADGGPWAQAGGEPGTGPVVFTVGGLWSRLNWKQKLRLVATGVVLLAVVGVLAFAFFWFFVFVILPVMLISGLLAMLSGSRRGVH